MVRTTPTVIIDTREQDPWSFANLPSETGTLDAGDHESAGRFVERYLFQCAQTVAIQYAAAAAVLAASPPALAIAEPCLPTGRQSAA